MPFALSPSHFRWWSCLRLILTGALLAGASLSARSRSSRQRDEIAYRCLVMLDGKGREATGWSLWGDATPADVRIAVDPDDRKNHAVQLLSTHESCYVFTFPEPVEDMTVVQWRCRLDEVSFYHYVECVTSEGVLNLRYTPGQPNQLLAVVDDKEPVIGLGDIMQVGEWVTVRRDVIADLRKLYPEIEVQSIRGLKFRGCGYIDDIRVYAYEDTDHDLLPDGFEKRRKLDPKDPADATVELVEEVIELTASVEGRAMDKVKDAAGPEDKGKSAPPKDQDVRRRVALSEAERDEMQQLFEARFAQRLAEIPPPEVGKTYQVRMRDGGEVSGVLAQFADGRIVLRTAHGSIALPIDRVNRRDSMALFPREAARQLALQDVQRRVDELIDAKVATAPQAAASVAPSAKPAATAVGEPAPEAPVAAVASVSSTKVDRPKYDPRPAPTPESLKPAMTAFAEWLTAQHRRVGARIVDRLFAKEQAGNAVLYLVMDSAFLGQEYDIRHRTTVGIQQFWSFRCQGLGVADLASSHVVLLDGNGRLVGGSRPEDAADIWVSER